MKLKDLNISNDLNIKLKASATKKEDIRRKLVVTATGLRLKAKKLAKTAKKKESVRSKLAVSAKKKESVRSNLAVIAKQLAVIAKEKESVRSKLAVTAEELRLKAKQLAVTAKEKESIRQKLVVTAEQLSLKAKLLAVTAKEKESIRRKLVVTAEQLSLKAKLLAVTAKDKESIRRKLVVTAEQLSLKAKLLAVTAKEKESVRSKLAVIAKQLAMTAQKKENVRSKLAIIAKQLAVTAKEKESIRRKLVVTAEQLAVIAEEKELIRRKLAVTAKELRIKAKQLAKTAKEKEIIRRKLVVTAEELRLKADSIKQAEAKEDAILASIDDGVMACDRDGQVVLFNHAAEELTGLSAKEAIGHNYNYSMNFIRESDEKISDDFIGKTILSGQAMKMSSHTLLVKKDGYKISVADSTAPVRDAKEMIIGCVVVFRDVTQEMKIDKAKTEFVSLASHQLRTPLTSINWYSEMLLAGDVGSLNPKQKSYLNEIYKGSKRMVDLVNALLNVSRMELGTFTVEPEPLNILTLARSVVAEFKHQIDQKKLKIYKNYAQHLPILKADPKLLRMVMQNLLANSIKYTPDKGRIKFVITLANVDGVVSTKDKKNNILIKVSDNGYGIPKNNQAKIFTKLFRADNVRAKDTKGTGLGLYIAKAIVDQSGGKIWFKSQENKGSIFYVTLPLTGMKKKKGTKALI